MEEAKRKAAQFKRQNDFIKNAYDRVGLLLPKGKKDLVKEAAQSAGVSMNEYINAAIDIRLRQEGAL